MIPVARQDPNSHVAGLHLGSTSGCAASGWAEVAKYSRGMFSEERGAGPVEVAERQGGAAVRGGRRRSGFAGRQSTDAYVHRLVHQCQ